jgi:hypothetical protein
MLTHIPINELLPQKYGNQWEKWWVSNEDIAKFKNREKEA